MSETGTVLIVDDSLVVRSVVRGWLEEQGHVVTEVEDGASAIERCLAAPPDVVLLDIEMPGLSGHDVLARLKSEPVVRDIPVVFLTNHASMEEVLRGLGGGAHDYLRKPFEPAELVARVRAVLRRGVVSSTPRVLRFGDLEIDEAGFRAHRAGRDLALTATEFKLLCELAGRPGQVFTRDLLLDLVWGYEFLGDSRLVDVAVQRLRSKIEVDPGRPALITTVRGVGYRFEPA